VFVADAADDLVIRPNPEEVMEVEWMRFSDLMVSVQQKPDRFTPWLRIYLRDHGEKIFGTMAVPV
jgi:isopentenyl-diphosphate delta-isomerase